MKTKIFLIFTVFTTVCFGANAEVVVNNHNNNNVNNNTINNTANSNQWDWRSDDAYREAQDIAVLENDIRILDAEIDKCKKKKKAWTAATVVGGVGVVATGVGAIVQANKISDKKAELADKNAELENAQQELRSLK